MSREDDGKLAKIVEKLPVEKLRELATAQLEALRFNLGDTLRALASQRRNYPMSPTGILELSYKSIKKQMERVGIWNERYAAVFKEAKDNGRFDAGQFYQED